MVPKIIHFTRHAQAEHNVEQDYSIPDSPLTALGREQAAKLNAVTVQTIQQTADLLVTSPLTRTLQTTILAFPALRARLEAQVDPKPIIPLSRLQEVNDHPCDTGSSKEVLAANPEFAGIDFSELEDDWNGKKGDFFPGNIERRAKWVRQWLRARPEKEIVVVAHGDVLRYITRLDLYSEGPWNNAEVRQYTFKEGDESDDAPVLRVKTEAQTGGEARTSSEFPEHETKWN